MRLPRITFGIIVLNGEPFTRHNLRALYPFAHEIIVVEGASERAAAIATPDGHSIDGTLEILRRFKAEEDPENKLTIVTAEDHGYPNGFWPGEKDEQSQAYAERAIGDYLWQVDIDEFYKAEDMMAILNMLHADPTITQVNVRWLNFWGGFDYLVDGLFLQKHYRDLGGGVPRLFTWGAKYCYITHRPPTVVDANGVDTRQGNWVRGNRLARRGIYCYHYGTLFPELVEYKMQYYQQMGWDNLGNFNEWYHSTFRRIQRPFRIQHISAWISWLRPFRGSHPSQIETLRSDIAAGELSVKLRQNDDIKHLLDSGRYRLGVLVLDFSVPLLLKLRALSPRSERLIERFAESFLSPSLSTAELE